MNEQEHLQRDITLDLRRDTSSQSLSSNEASTYDCTVSSFHLLDFSRYDNIQTFLIVFVTGLSAPVVDLSLRGNSDRKLQLASNASCPDQYRKFVGDGWCDNGLDGGVNLNLAACDFDGGDCCRSSCDLAMSQWADRPDDGVYFYCGAAGYHCADPRYVDIDRNLSSNGTNNDHPQNYTLLVLSESRFTGSALVVNKLQQKNHRSYVGSSNQKEVTYLMEYLFWNALDISAGNILVAGDGGASSPPSSTPAPPPKRPPRPPVVPPVADVTGKKTPLEISQELVTGQRWLVQNVAVQSHLYRRRYAVSEVSWTMVWQTIQYIAVEDSDAKGTLGIANSGATASLDVHLQQQQSMQSNGWISADILQRSLRYAASAQSMRLLSMIAVCDSHTTNSTSTANDGAVSSHEYSLETMQECLSNFSSIAMVAAESDELWALYDSPACLARSSDSWLQYYGTEQYMQWMIAYVVLWMLLLLVAAGYLVNQSTSSNRSSSGSSGGWLSCLMLSKNIQRHHLLTDTAAEIPGPAAEPASSAVQPGASRRSLHRRRVLQRVLSFYSYTSFTPTDRDGEIGGGNDDAAGRNLPIWTRMWALLRVPGVFSRATVAWLVVITSALRISHYVWVLTPYFKESLSGHDHEAMNEVRAQMVCREFAFTATYSSSAAEEEALVLEEASNGWSRSFLMCLWLVGFHTFFAWAMLAAVARHVHVTVRRAMVRLSLPYLPQTPPPVAANEGPGDHVTAAGRTQQNPLTRAPLPASATIAGTLAASALSSESASALSASSSKAPAVAASPVRLPRPVDIAHREDDHVHAMDADTQAAIRAAARHSSQLHSTLVPALLHLQVFHFLVIVLVCVLVATCLLWLAIGVSVQETTLRTAVREEVITVLTASEAPLVYLHWVERIAGGISLLEGITLLSTMHWLARLYQLVSQHQWRTGPRDEPLVTMATTGQWLLLYVATALLFLQGALTIITSHRYFQEATMADGLDGGSSSQGRRTFAVYSMALRVVEWATMLVVAVLLTQPMMTLDGSDAATTDLSMMHEGRSLTPNGSGFSTPYYSEILGQDGDEPHDDHNPNKDTDRNSLRNSREAAAKGATFDMRGPQYWPSEAGFFGLKRESGGGDEHGWSWNRLWPLWGTARGQEGDATREGDVANREKVSSSVPLGDASVWLTSWYERVKSTDGGRDGGHETITAAGERGAKNVAIIRKAIDGEEERGGGGSVVWTTSALASMATSLWNPAPSHAGQRHHPETVTSSGHFDDSPPPFVSFHFPQLPKGPDATVVLSDVSSAVPSPKTGNDSLRSSYDKSDTVISARPLYGSKGVAGSWPASLFARRHPRHPHGGLRLHEPLPETDELLVKNAHHTATESTCTTETQSMRPDIESTTSSLESLPPSPSVASTVAVTTLHAVPAQL